MRLPLFVFRMWYPKTSLGTRREVFMFSIRARDCCASKATRKENSLDSPAVQRNKSKENHDEL